MTELNDNTASKTAGKEQGGAVSTQPEAVKRRENVLKKAIIQGGKGKDPGDKVFLRPDQAMRFQKEGVI